MPCLTSESSKQIRLVIEVEDFGFAISQIAQTTLRSVLGRAELDDLLSEREKLNQDLEDIVKNIVNRGVLRCWRWKSRT